MSTSTRRGYAEVASGGATVSPAYVAHPAALLDRPCAGCSGPPPDRAPHFGCFGMHEWAMVYRLAPDDVRHSAWPLRLGAPGTDEVVEGHRIACSHFDAFRFFTEAARPRNTLQPAPRRPRRLRAAGLPARRDGPLQARLPAHPAGPLRAGRRLLRAGPRHPRARHARVAVRPVRLTSACWEPWPRAIETPEGKGEYAAAQRGFAERAAPLRQD